MGCLGKVGVNMAGSAYGSVFRVTTWGESHGDGIGAVVDGCPAGIELCEKDIQRFLDRRKPGQSKYATPRKEDDTVKILSGVFEGRTTGTPVSMLVGNTSQRSSDYSELAKCYRPGHADYTFDMKYGFRDYRGGGRSSGRETIGRVAAGAIASKILSRLGISINAYTKSIGQVTIDYDRFNLDEAGNNPFSMPDAKAAAMAEELISALMSEHDSVGGVVECVIKNMIPGIGEPVFDKFSANLAKAVMSIGAVKGFEIGDGFEAARLTGRINNDGFRMENGKVIKTSNHSGGMLGGMSDGSDIIFRAAFKPTPSISSIQHTVNTEGENIDISIKGRHDPLIVPRAVVVVESMAAIAAVDMIFSGMAARMDKIAEFYDR